MRQVCIESLFLLPVGERSVPSASAQAYARSVATRSTTPRVTARGWCHSAPGVAREVKSERMRIRCASHAVHIFNAFIRHRHGYDTPAKVWRKIARRHARVKIAQRNGVASVAQSERQAQTPAVCIRCQDNHLRRLRGTAKKRQTVVYVRGIEQVAVCCQTARERPRIGRRCQTSHRQAASIAQRHARPQHSRRQSGDDCA